MKKYLITGALALVACATFTSCHSDDDFTGSIVESKMQTYEQVFKQEFGEINPNQDWGFGDASVAARTRALLEGYRTRGNASTNANEWASKGYDVPQELTALQIERVVAYFQNNQLSDGGYKDWTDFFVQQVYKGHTSALGDKDDPENPYSPEEYQAANGTWYNAGNQMDYLTANGSEEHINNFNAADGSSNSDVQNSEGIHYYTDNGNGYHTDKIQLMVDSRATNFGYHNSQANYYYWNHYVLVDGSVIDTWATTYGNNVGESVSGRAFVGLDFDMLPLSECESDKTFKISDWDSQVKYVKNADNTYSSYDATQEYTYNNATVKKLNDKTNFYYAEDKITISDNVLFESVNYEDLDPDTEQKGFAGKALNKAYLDNLIAHDYRPTSSNLREWIKIGSCRDYYFSDWIVCIAPGHQTQVNPDTDEIPIETGENNFSIEKHGKKIQFVDAGRIICEDLGTVSASDIDFNDIVFDAYLFKETPVKVTYYREGTDGPLQFVGEEAEGATAYYGKIFLLAAGGTLPVTVDGQIVNDLFDPTLGHTFIINTIKEEEGAHGNRWENFNKAPSFDITDYDKLKDIPIIVKYGSEALKLEAFQGAAPHKICVPINTYWPLERVSIKSTYPKFSNYVGTGEDQEVVYTPKNDEDDPADYGNGNIGKYNNQKKDPNGYFTVPTDGTYYDKTVSYTAPETTLLRYEFDEKQTQIFSGGGYREGDPVLVRKRH